MIRKHSPNTSSMEAIVVTGLMVGAFIWALQCRYRHKAPVPRPVRWPEVALPYMVQPAAVPGCEVYYLRDTVFEGSPRRAGKVWQVRNIIVTDSTSQK